MCPAAIQQWRRFHWSRQEFSSNGGDLAVDDDDKVPPAILLRAKEVGPSRILACEERSQYRWGVIYPKQRQKELRPGGDYEGVRAAVQESGSTVRARNDIAGGPLVALVYRIWNGVLG
jgi:hypothetical protein